MTYMQKIYSQRKQAGLCPRCQQPLPAEETHVHCAACRRKDAEKMRRTRANEKREILRSYARRPDKEEGQG